MGQKVSAVNGVRSENYVEPNNAINEIWVGDIEIISRLPFGDSDMAQAGWPKGGTPKIPWHNFIIPMKRGLGLGCNTPVNISCSIYLSTTSQVPSDEICCTGCNQTFCTIDPLLTNCAITNQLVKQNPTILHTAVALAFIAWAVLPWAWRGRKAPSYDPARKYDADDVRWYASVTRLNTLRTFVGLVIGVLAVVFWRHAHQMYKFRDPEWLKVERGYYAILLLSVVMAVWIVRNLRTDLRLVSRSANSEQQDVLGDCKKCPETKC